MKTLLMTIALILPTMSSAAEFLDVECYIADGTEVTKTFDGYVFGTVKTVGNKVVVEGKNIATSYRHDRSTPDTCKAPSHSNYDNDGYSYEVEDSNVTAYEFDFAQVELSCALGSVVKRFGDLANFTKAMEAQARRNAGTSSKPQCLDFAGIQ